MTCDLIIGNGAGVALATEVVPATSHYERPDPTTTTMLGLPKPHAVGIIIHSGRSTIFGVPYETHLENWIQTLSEKPLGRLGSYAKSFRSHLEDVISANVSDSEVLRDFIWSWHDWLCKVRSGGDALAPTDVGLPLARLLAPVPERLSDHLRRIRAKGPGPRMRRRQDRGLRLRQGLLPPPLGRVSLIIGRWRRKLPFRDDRTGP